MGRGSILIRLSTYGWATAPALRATQCEIVARDSAIGGTVSSGVAPSHIVLDDLNLQRARRGGFLLCSRGSQLRGYRHEKSDRAPDWHWAG